MSVNKFELITWVQHDSSNLLIVLIEWYKIYRTTDQTSGKEGAIWKLSTKLIISIQCQNFISIQALTRKNLIAYFNSNKTRSILSRTASESNIQYKLLQYIHLKEHNVEQSETPLTD